MVLQNLNQANTALFWARMALKSAKSRCLVVTDGKFQQDIALYVSESNIDVSILSISNHPAKFLGRTISVTVSHKDPMEVISSAVSKGLALVNKPFHGGVHKVWNLQHLLVHQLRWPLLTYKISDQQFFV